MNTIENTTPLLTEAPLLRNEKGEYIEHQYDPKIFASKNKNCLHNHPAPTQKEIAKIKINEEFDNKIYIIEDDFNINEHDFAIYTQPCNNKEPWRFTKIEELNKERIEKLENLDKLDEKDIPAEIIASQERLTEFKVNNLDRIIKQKREENTNIIDEREVIDIPALEFVQKIKNIAKNFEGNFGEFGEEIDMQNFITNISEQDICILENITPRDGMEITIGEPQFIGERQGVAEKLKDMRYFGVYETPIEYVLTREI